MVLSSKESYRNKGAFKHFIGYISNISIIPLHTKLAQMDRLVNYFNSNSKYMNFLVCDTEIFKKYNAVSNKVHNLFKKEVHSESVYNDKYIKAKINLYNVNFYYNKMPKENEFYTCLFVILLDSVVDVNKKYYSQIFLEECIYAVKNKEIINTVNEELNLDKSDHESDNDQD